MKKLSSFTFLVLFFASIICTAQTTSLVSIDAQGVLTYTPDSNGNVIPDFSMVGYQQGNQPIPNVPVRVTLNPATGDRYADIQAAIDSVAAMTPDAFGHRGAVLLTAGNYEVSQTLNINTSGIVLRGQGKGSGGTSLEITATTQTNLLSVSGSSNINRTGSTAKQISDPYVPIGANTVSVASGHSFQVGDRVVLQLHSNAAWMALLGMDNLATICGSGHSNWRPQTIKYKRRVTQVSGNQITLDAPFVDPVDSAYYTADLAKYTWPTKIEECGVENIKLLSSYTSNTDENHGWVAIELRNIENAWVKDVDAYYFGYGCVSARAGAYQVSVLNCGMFDYKSRVSGGRRYGFNSDDCDLVLFRNCVSDQGRHDFVQGSRTPGPNVYTRCTATNSFSDLGPHHRWSTGTLWDMVTTNSDLNVQNRLCSGSGHGWAGAQQVFWNCTATKMIVQDPPANPTNWAIGCTGNITNLGRYAGVNEPLGVVESPNVPITAIPSLYDAQLNARLNPSLAVDLVYFHATNVDNEYVQLEWKSSSEINHELFSVERSVDGSVWEVLTEIGGNGSPSFYRTRDNSPFKGLSYYRLKQRDLNGRISYSETEYVKIGLQGRSSIRIYPNPSTGLVHVQGEETEVLNEVRVYNTLGQVVSGFTWRRINASGFVIDLSVLESGIYFVKMDGRVGKVYKR